jgi:hypothetical protein
VRIRMIVDSILLDAGRLDDNPAAQVAGVILAESSQTFVAFDDGLHMGSERA